MNTPGTVEQNELRYADADEMTVETGRCELNNRRAPDVDAFRLTVISTP